MCLTYLSMTHECLAKQPLDACGQALFFLTMACVMPCYRLSTSEKSVGYLGV